MTWRLSFNLEFGKADDQPEREGSADSLVERADPGAPPLGFCPPKHPYEPPTEDA